MRSRDPLSPLNRSLFNAVKAGDNAAITQALDKKADILALDEEGEPLANHVPYYDPHRSIPTLELLRARGANLSGVQGKPTPLHRFFQQMDHAPYREHTSVYSVEELYQLLSIFKGTSRQATVDMNAPDDKGRPPIFDMLPALAEPEYLQVMKEFGIKFDLHGNNGRTLAHHWAEYLELDGLRFLVSQGVPLNVVDAHGNTPLHAFARQEAASHQPIIQKVRDMVTLLRAHGVDLEARNHDNKTAEEILKTANNVTYTDWRHGDELAKMIAEEKGLEAPETAALKAQVDRFFDFIGDTKMPQHFRVLEAIMNILDKRQVSKRLTSETLAGSYGNRDSLKAEFIEKLRERQDVLDWQHGHDHRTPTKDLLRLFIADLRKHENLTGENDVFATYNIEGGSDPKPSQDDMEAAPPPMPPAPPPDTPPPAGAPQPPASDKSLDGKVLWADFGKIPK